MKRWLALAGAMALSACGGTTPTPPPAAPSTPIPAKSAAAATKGVSCLELSRIREARVVDDQTIDFYVNNREVLRNTLPHACPGLGFERAFTYATSLSQLCSVDIITVVVQGGGPHTGATCGLGSFVPYTPVPK